MSDLPRQIEILDCLVDGPSSFAAMYGELGQRLGPQDVGRLFDEVVVELQECKWLSTSMMDGSGDMDALVESDRLIARAQYLQWLPTTEHDNLSLDEVGVWLEITQAGRDEWEKWREANSLPAQWTIQDDAVRQEVVIRAEDPKLAEHALSIWTELYPGNTILGRDEREIDSFVLRNDETVQDGVEWRVSYESSKRW